MQKIRKGIQDFRKYVMNRERTFVMLSHGVEDNGDDGQELQSLGRQGIRHPRHVIDTRYIGSSRRSAWND